MSTTARHAAAQVIVNSNLSTRRLAFLALSDRKALDVIVGANGNAEHAAEFYARLTDTAELRWSAAEALTIAGWDVPRLRAHLREIAY